MSKQSEEKQANNTWSASQAYALAVVCLVSGLVLGYLFRGSAGPAAATPPQAQGAPATAQEGQGQRRGPASAEALLRVTGPLIERAEKNPKDVEVLTQLGNIYSDHGFHKEAIPYYEKALAIKPDPNISTDLGTAYFYSGDADRALRQFEVSLSIDPKHGQSMFNKGVVLWQGKQDLDGAVASWTRLLKEVPDYPQKDQVRELIQRAKNHPKIG